MLSCGLVAGVYIEPRAGSSVGLLLFCRSWLLHFFFIVKRVSPLYRVMQGAMDKA